MLEKNLITPRRLKKKFHEFCNYSSYHLLQLKSKKTSAEDLTAFWEILLLSREHFYKILNRYLRKKEFLMLDIILEFMLRSRIVSRIDFSDKSFSQQWIWSFYLYQTKILFINMEIRKRFKYHRSYSDDEAISSAKSFLSPYWTILFLRKFCRGKLPPTFLRWKFS